MANLYKYLHAIACVVVCTFREQMHLENAHWVIRRVAPATLEHTYRAFEHVRNSLAKHHLSQQIPTHSQNKECALLKEKGFGMARTTKIFASGYHYSHEAARKRLGAKLPIDHA